MDMRKIVQHDEGFKHTGSDTIDIEFSNPNWACNTDQKIE